jgi:phage terminase large subunit-like protein
MSAGRAIAETMSTSELLALGYDWSLAARPEQLPPPAPAGHDAWDVWVYLAGRGAGKTRSASEWCREKAKSMPGTIGHLVARTAADARDTMVQGESGILAVCAGDVDNRPTYNPSNRLIRWPNGTIVRLFSAEEPNALRGPQCHWWWADELCAWKYVRDTWDQLQYGARLGDHVQGIVTTTPRPIALLRKIIDSPTTVVSRGSTMVNAPNLAPNFLKKIMDDYGGTRLGRQEIYGEILDDNPNALWSRDMIEMHRVTIAPALSNVVVGVDPAASDGEDACSTGIVGSGRDYRDPAHYYVLADCTVQGARPDEWGRASVAAYRELQADCIAPERNNGGDMVEHVLRTIDPAIPIRPQWASRGKRTRAEPIAALSEQGRLHFVGSFPALEDQMCEWQPNVDADSPDRVDALVWSITALMSETKGRGGVVLGAGGF